MIIMNMKSNFCVLFSLIIIIYRSVYPWYIFRECCLKLGDKLGNEVWNAVNNAFDTMPIAATVDGKVNIYSVKFKEVY